MKNHILLLLLFLLSFCQLIVAQEDQVKNFDYFTFPITTKMKGAVKSSKAFLYEVKKIGIKKLIAKRETEFNRKGEFTRDIFYNGKTIESEITRVFDNGILSREIVCTQERKSSYLPLLQHPEVPPYELKCLYITVQYYENGLLKEKTYYNKDSTVNQVIKWYYNKQKSLTRRDTYASNNKLWYRLTCLYNENGKIISESECNNDTTTFSLKKVYIYNNNDSLIEKNVFINSPSKPEGVYTEEVFKYNTKGKLSEYYAYNSENILISKEINLYDEKGNLTELDKLNSEGTVMKHFTYENIYNEKGLIAEKIEKDDKGLVISRKKYYYDAIGNCIKVKVYINEDKNSDKRHYTNVRKIKYYKN